MYVHILNALLTNVFVLSLTQFRVRPYIVYMLRDTEIREDWAAITIAVKQSQEYLRHHDGG